MEDKPMAESPKELKMEELFEKYKGGKIPPLLADDSFKGLVDGDLLQVYQRGFSIRYANVPLGILLAAERYSYFSDKWENGYYGYNKWASEDWTGFCKKLRNAEKGGRRPGDEECELCDRKAATIAEEKGGAIAYMCFHGMIEFAVPITVMDEVIAVAITGQKKPEPGRIWPKMVMGPYPSIALIEPYFDGEGIDAWTESQRRIRECEKKIGFEEGALIEEVLRDSEIEISPEDLERIKVYLQVAGRHLSDLASKTYILEKESLRGWLRAEIANALYTSEELPPSPDVFWGKIRWSLAKIVELIGADYALIISCEEVPKTYFHLHCQYGLTEDNFSTREYEHLGSETAMYDFMNMVKSLKEVGTINIEQYNSLPIFEKLHSIYNRQQEGIALLVPMIDTRGNIGFMIIGRHGAGTGTIKLRKDDEKYLMMIAQDLTIVIDVFSLITKLREATRAQTQFIESVAHDLRTPIQNIMVAADNLREKRIPSEDIPNVVSGIVTQLERLYLLSQKAWRLEEIRLGRYYYDDTQKVSPYQLFSECRNLLMDIAEEYGLEIKINDEVKRWPAIQIDVEMFRLAVLNLIHNAIKYSYPNSEIRIGGWRDIGGYIITFGNIGIPIHNDEKERIFERYFRGKEAIAMHPAGTGIGLTIVKAFVEHYEGEISIESKPIDSGRHLTVFRLFIPK